MRKIIVGVMGGGETASLEDCNLAYNLGGLIAAEGWLLLNGGRSSGVMEASAKGAREKGGLTIGILPDTDNKRSSQYIDIPIITGLGDGRNYINILTSNIIVALPGKAGTISEIALALKNRKTTILLNFYIGTLFDIYKEKGLLKCAQSVEETIQIIKKELNNQNKNERAELSGPIKRGE